MCDLRVQHRLFLPQHFQHSFFLSQHCCVFAPVFLVHSLAVWITLALQNMPPKARAPEARMVFGWDQVSRFEFCTFSGPSRCLPTVCIPSCCIFSPDQGRATATISSRFGCMESSCHHQRTLSPMLQCCHFQHRSLGVQSARPAGILGHSSHCKAQLCDDMQFCLVTQVPSKARCQSRCASSQLSHRVASPRRPRDDRATAS